MYGPLYVLVVLPGGGSLGMVMGGTGLKRGGLTSSPGPLLITTSSDTLPVLPLPLAFGTKDPDV